MSYYSINDALRALAPIGSIPRPDGDNEGDSINSDSVYPYLSALHQRQVDHALEVLFEYTRAPDGTPNRRSLTTLGKHGYPASLHESQYDNDYMDGNVRADAWDIDIADQRARQAD